MTDKTKFCAICKKEIEDDEPDIGVLIFSRKDVFFHYHKKCAKSTEELIAFLESEMKGEIR